MCSCSSAPYQKMILFLWFHKLQQPAIIATLKKLLEDLLFASIIIECNGKVSSHDSPSFSQKSTLKGHEKNKWGIVSGIEPSHRTHDVDSTWKFFLVSKSLVFTRSCIINQKKNLCFGRQGDFHIHLNIT